MNTTETLKISNDLRSTEELQQHPRRDQISSIVAKKSQEIRSREEDLKTRVEALQQTEWELKLSQLDQMSKREIKEREMLIQQVRHAEERNASLTKQFNELYQYCESLYQDADGRRKIAEEKLLLSQSEMSGYVRRFEEQQKRIDAFAFEAERAEEREERIVQENNQLQGQIRNLKEQLDQKRGERAISLSSLERGKEFIQSSVRSLSDFYGTFETYLESVEKNGVTPITQRTGRLFIEHWKIQRENLQAATASVNDLLDASSENN